MEVWGLDVDLSPEWRSAWVRIRGRRNATKEGIDGLRPSSRSRYQWRHHRNAGDLGDLAPRVRPAHNSCGDPPFPGYGDAPAPLPVPPPQAEAVPRLLLLPVDGLGHAGQLRGGSEPPGAWITRARRGPRRIGATRRTPTPRKSRPAPGTPLKTSFWKRRPVGWRSTRPATSWRRGTWTGTCLCKCAPGPGRGGLGGRRLPWNGAGGEKRVQGESLQDSSGLIRSLTFGLNKLAHKSLKRTERKVKWLQCRDGAQRQ